MVFCECEALCLSARGCAPGPADSPDISTTMIDSMRRFFRDARLTCKPVEVRGLEDADAARRLLDFYFGDEDSDVEGQPTGTTFSHVGPGWTVAAVAKRKMDGLSRADIERELAQPYVQNA